MNKTESTENESTARPLSFGASLPRLYPGAWTRFIYYLFEPLWWSIWFRHTHRIHGQLPDSACVVVANHGSYLDWILLHVVLRRYLKRNIQFLAKEKVIRHPLFRVMVRATESIVVEDARKSRAALAAIRVLSGAGAARDAIIGVFPEGTRSRDGKPLPAFAGAARIARKAGVPIVPVALSGFFEAWPSQSLLPRFKRRRLSIHFLSPLNTADFADDQVATDAAMNQIYSVVRQQRTETASRP